MDISAITEIVDPIIDDVKKHGDSAVIGYTNEFDGVALDKVLLKVDELKVILSAEVKSAIDLAYNNIYTFHLAQKAKPLEVETMPGVVCRRVAKPIERVGLYVPGGTAILPSSALMLGIPAQIAGCKTIVLATPPRKDGTIAPEVAYVAQKTGVTHILLAGGAQAVAAMAYGTESIPKVDKIFGPGNQFVTAAKMQLQNSDAMIAIDMPAGPSEVLVIADQHAKPAFVAADLLSQAEHGKDSQVVLVAIDGFDVNALQKVLAEQLADLERKETAKEALKNSYIINVKSADEAMDFSNKYAPEHLIIQTENADLLAERVVNAGSVFIGDWTPESVGDYASGTNHTLPTYGYARMYSGVNLAAYQKFITMQQLSEEGIKQIGPAVETLANTEGLGAHALAVTLRLNALKKD
jgi:histidinol dehydrogenase